MATIKSQMALDDGVSRVLSRMNKALDITINAFEEIQSASGYAFDTTRLQEAHVLLAESGQEIQKMADYYATAGKMEEKLNQSIREGTSAADGLLGKVASIAGTYMSMSKVKSLITESLGDADIQIGAQVQLKSVMGNMGSLDAYGDILDKAASIEANGMFGDEAMIAGAAELATYFEDAEALMSMMDTLTDYAAGMSLGEAVDAKQMTDYATNLGKIMSGSYQAMTEKGFKFTDAQKAVIDGTATQAQVVEALGAEYLSMSNDMQAAAVINDIIGESWAGMYEAMSSTPQGQIAQFNNALGSVRETIGVGIYPAVLNFFAAFRNNMPQVQSLANGFAATIGTVLTLLTRATEGALAFAGAIQDNWSWIEPIILGIAAALLIYNGYLAVSSALTAVDNIQKGIAAVHAYAAAAANKALSAAKREEAMATASATAAQYGFNAALLACPVTWVIVIILAVITAVIAAVRAFNLWGAQTHTVVGTITGVLAVAVAFIGNLFLGLINTVIGLGVNLHNLIATFANFFANVFNNPVSAIMHLFAGLFDYILGIVQSAAKLLDTVFGSSLADAVAGFRSAVSTKVDDLVGGQVEVMEKLDASAFQFDRINYGDAFQAGATWGDGLSDKITGLFDYELGTMEDFMAGVDYNTAGIGNDTGEIADSAAKAAGALDVSNETLEYLRDIAERDAINRFTTAEVKIDMTGMTNRIEGEADLDGVLSTLTDGFAEALVVAAEGVHA